MSTHALKFSRRNNTCYHKYLQMDRVEGVFMQAVSSVSGYHMHAYDQLVWVSNLSIAYLGMEWEAEEAEEALRGLL